MRLRDTIRGRWRWGAVLVAAGLAGAAVAGQSQAAPAASKVPAFSAVQLADGLLFKDGPATPYLASLDREPVRWTDPLRKARESVDEAISRDPKWGASFAQRIQSGDPNQVLRGLTDLSVLSRGVLDKLFGADVVDKAVATVNDGIAAQLIDDTQVTDNMVQLDKAMDNVFAYIAVETQDSGMDVTVAFDSDVAVAIQKTAVLIATETSFWVITNMPAPDSAIYQEGMLIQELLVRTIAENLQSAKYAVG
jgi:hypothetical protein